MSGEHSPDGGRGFRGVWRKIEAGWKSGTDGGQGCARLHAQGVVFRGMNPIHVREIQHDSAFRYRAAGHTGSGALRGEGHPQGTCLGKAGKDIGFGAGKSNAIRSSLAAGFVAQIIGMGGLKCFTHGWQYNLPRDGLHG